VVGARVRACINIMFFRHLFSRRLSAVVAQPQPSLGTPNILTRMMSSAAALEQQYARPIQWMHWVYAAGMTTVLGSVLAAQKTTKEYKPVGMSKGDLMMIHKSTAVILAALVVPRILLRAASTVPKALPVSFPEHVAADLTHVALYSFMVGMPATGLAMGYYGGKGVPFFGLFTIPGKADKTKEDGKFAGKMFGWHKWAGNFMWYLVPLHIAGAAQHYFRGHTIFTRINPLAPR